MKTIKITFAFVVIFLMAINISCRKKSQDSILLLDKFFEKYGAQSQFFTIDASRDTTIYGAMGTRLDLKAWSLCYGNSIPVSGAVQIEMKEIYNKSQMVLSNAQTVSDNKILASGGEVYLSATQNNYTVLLCDSQTAKIYFPAESPNGEMQLFTGYPGGYSEYSNSINGSYWSQSQPTQYTATAYDSTLDTWYNSFDISGFQFINCDHFWDTDGCDLSVNLNSGFDNGNTVIYFVFESENCVANSNKFENKLFMFNSNGRIPIGLPITVFAIASRNDEFYFGKTQAVTSADEIKFDLKKSTEQEIVAAANAL